MKIRLVTGLFLSLIVYLDVAVLLDATRGFSDLAVISKIMTFLSAGLLEMELRDGLKLPVYPALLIAVALGFWQFSLYGWRRRALILQLLIPLAVLLYSGASLAHLFLGIGDTVIDGEYVVFGKFVLSSKEMIDVIVVSCLIMVLFLLLQQRSFKKSRRS